MADIPLLPSLLMTVTFYAADCCLEAKKKKNNKTDIAIYEADCCWGKKKKKKKRITSQILLVKLAKPDYQQNKWPTANS